MPRFQWTLVFDADNEDVANQQVQDAIDSFDSYYSDDLIELDD